MRCEPLAERARVHPNASARAHASENRSPAGLALALFRRSSLAHRRNRSASRRLSEWYHNRYHGSTGMEGGLDGVPGTPYGARWPAKTHHQSLSRRTSGTLARAFSSRFGEVHDPESYATVSSSRLYRRAIVSDTGTSPASSMSMSKSYEKLLSAARYLRLAAHAQALAHGRARAKIRDARKPRCALKGNGGWAPRCVNPAAFRAVNWLVSFY